MPSCLVDKLFLAAGTNLDMSGITFRSAPVTISGLACYIFATFGLFEMRKKRVSSVAFSSVVTKERNYQEENPDNLNYADFTGVTQGSSFGPSVFILYT